MTPRSPDPLDGLIEDAAAVAEGLATDDAFLEWREKALATMSGLLGAEHELTCQLRTMRFKVPPQLLEWNGDALGAAVGAKVRFDQRHFFRERVFEAQEILITARVCLRTGQT